ncbi:complexin-2 [Oribacterium sp. C9]|uniref:hypothetical protein n=1 Tax=unclassified Oribacterium TaxID=2629782 RepID=UPI0003DF1462|nr:MULTISPECIES: hypothetical protein [unclassified Oribacterium]ETP71261.1 hypothetical protein UYO_2789 [Lachnospiraceae bacterium JC7]OON88409.1 complexin-2 [Oribacterium sp. C9]SFG36052.1 hypothetical protein SAMN05216356_106145 [Oribacterium sp. WCC10]
MKNVLISRELFLMILKYHLFGIERFDEDIRKGLKDKLHSMERHDTYSKSKTAPTEAEREKSRKEYLDMIGMHQDYRW